MNRLLTVLFAVMSVTAFAAPPDQSIWLDAPAKLFTESLPLGNGRLGAMDFGGIADERIALNEDSLWSGSVQVGSSRVDLQACKLEYSIVSPK